MFPDARTILRQCLRVVGAHACAGFGSAGAGEDGVVAVDFEPRGEHGGSSDVGLSAAWRESPAGIESETKRAPPIFTKPRRVMGAVSGVRIVTDATGNSLDAFIFGVIEAPAFPRASRWRRVARHR